MADLIKAKVWLLGKCDLCGTPIDRIEREGTTVWHFHVAPEPVSGMPHTPAQGCTCHPTDESTWTRYGSAVEPGSMWEPDPGCPEHGAHTEIDDEPDLSLIPAELIVRDPEICSGRPTMRGTHILASRIAGELAAGTSWELLHEWYPSMPVPATQPGAGDAETSGTGSDRGTGVPEAQNSRQATDGLNSRHWLKWNTITRTITGCQCGFGANEDSDCGFGDSVVAHLLKVAAEASRPVHYREAAASIRDMADADETAEPPIGGETNYLLGMRRAADRLGSVARDLDEEAGR